jgi:hypothetical protein
VNINILYTMIFNSNLLQNSYSFIDWIRGTWIYISELISLDGRINKDVWTQKNYINLNNFIRYPYFDVVVGLVLSHARQVKGDDPDKKGYPGPPGWGFGVGLTAQHSKKCIVMKVEQRKKLDRFNDDGGSWWQTGKNGRIFFSTGQSPLRAVVPIQEEEIILSFYIMFKHKLILMF